MKATTKLTPSYPSVPGFRAASSKLVLPLAILLFSLAVFSQAQTYDAQSLASFNNTNGSGPYAALVEYNGNFYGTTQYGGKNNVGTIFKVTPKGVLTTLYAFDRTHGAVPEGALVESGGKFYGTTSGGGAYGTGTVFEFTPPARSGTYGTVTVMHNFELNSIGPAAGLVLGTDGYFYGTTMSGGKYLQGTLFKIEPASPYTLTTLYNFCPDIKEICPDGSQPQAALIEYGGKFYGTTVNGGTGTVGTVFAYTPGKAGAIGTLATLHSFNKNTEGLHPYAGLVEFNGNFYGTTETGGLYRNQENGAGTIFELTTAGKLTTLHVFTGEDGANPEGTLIEYGGKLFGTAFGGGTLGYGSVFEFAPGTDSLLSLIDFSNQTDVKENLAGNHPFAGLTEYDGGFYGVTWAGGASYDGTVFSIVP